MRLKGRFCKALFCLALGLASLGAPMPPEEIEELLCSMNQPKIAQTLPEEHENADDLIRKLLRR